MLASCAIFFVFIGKLLPQRGGEGGRALRNGVVDADEAATPAAALPATFGIPPGGARVGDGGEGRRAARRFEGS